MATETALIAAIVAFAITCSALFFCVAYPIIRQMRRAQAEQAASILKSAVQFVTATDAQGAELALVKVDGWLSDEAAERLKRSWEGVFYGTALDGVKVVFLEHGMDVEFVRTRDGGNNDVAVN